jgi:hypothetical protein
MQQQQVTSSYENVASLLPGQEKSFFVFRLMFTSECFHGSPPPQTLRRTIFPTLDQYHYFLLMYRNPFNLFPLFLYIIKKFSYSIFLHSLFHIFPLFLPFFTWMGITYLGYLLLGLGLLVKNTFERQECSIL